MGIFIVILIVGSSVLGWIPGLACVFRDFEGSYYKEGAGFRANSGSSTSGASTR